MLQVILRGAVLLPERERRLAAICAALEPGADVGARDRDGYTALHLVAASLNPNDDTLSAALEALLMAGADVQAKDNCGMEPLHTVAHSGSTEAAAAAIQALIAAGANVSAADNAGRQPLHFAVQNGNANAATAAVLALVKAGADLNASAADGSRPLHCAAGRLIPAVMLVRLGASLSLRDGAGRTALEVAAGGNTAFEAALHRAAERERLCNYCGAGGEHLKRCKRCRAATYCR